jgi:hypothetical protein
MKFLNRVVVLAVLALTCLKAQDITKGSISGVVRDASGAVVPAATVKLTSPYGDRTTTTNAVGVYTFQNLVVGPGYGLSVTRTGFSVATVSNLAVGVNQQTTYDFNLEVGTAAQTVDVTAESAGIDLSTTTVGANINEDLFKNVPIGRNISAVMTMAPGVDDSMGAGNANPSINGASGLENEYIINGANVTDPGFGGFGTYSQTYGPLGNGINFDFVQEVQVQTGGFEPQYGQALGGVVNVITKSGSNQYHGDVFAYFQPKAFEATRTNPNPLLVTKRDYLMHQATIDYGADAGGYILKDKLFWYGGFNPLYLSNYRQADPVYANYALGVIHREITTYDYTGKLNYNLGSKNQFEGSVFGDPSSTPMTFQGRISAAKVPAAPSTATESQLSFGSRTWTGRYNGTLSPNWVVTANYSNYYNSLTNTPLLNGYQITDNTSLQAGTGGAATYGGIGFNPATESKENQFTVASTNVFRFLGGHTLQYGYQFEDDIYNEIYVYTGAPFVLPNLPELQAAAGKTLYGASFTREYSDPTNLSSPIVLDIARGVYSSPNIATDTRYHAGYIQDSWTMGRITLKPGLRFEQQALIGNTEHISFAHNWAPRMGIIVDPFNNRRTKVFATIGRFFEKVPQDIAVRSLSIETQVSGAIYKDPGASAQPNLSTSNYIPGGLPGSGIAFQGSAADAEPIAPGTAAQYQDEIAAGVEHEFAHNLTFTGRFVYRDLRRVLEDMSGINVTQATAPTSLPQIYVIGNPSASLDIFQNSSPCTVGTPNCINYGTATSPLGYTAFKNGTTNPNGPDGIPDGFPNPSRIYKSMELIVAKRFSKAQFNGSYVLSKLDGNFPGNFRTDNYQDDPNISSLFDFTNSDGKLTGQTIPGVLGTDRTHQFKFYGNYMWRALNFGLSWTPTSGTPITKFLDHPVYTNAGELPVCPNGGFTCPGGPRGAEGRTPWIFPVNFHADYTWKFGEKYRLKAVADLFNIFDQQRVQHVNQYAEPSGSPGTANPDFLKPDVQSGYFPDPYQLPFQARLAVRFEF